MKYLSYCCIHFSVNATQHQRSPILTILEKHREKKHKNIDSTHVQNLNEEHKSKSSQILVQFSLVMLLGNLY